MPLNMFIQKLPFIIQCYGILSAIYVFACLTLPAQAKAVIFAYGADRLSSSLLGNVQRKVVFIVASYVAIKLMSCFVVY